MEIIDGPITSDFHKQGRRPSLHISVHTELGQMPMKLINILKYCTSLGYIRSLSDYFDDGKLSCDTRAIKQFNYFSSFKKLDGGNLSTFR